MVNKRKTKLLWPITEEEKKKPIINLQRQVDSDGIQKICAFELLLYRALKRTKLRPLVKLSYEFLLATIDFNLHLYVERKLGKFPKWLEE
jgi:hypothetical protein